MSHKMVHRPGCACSVVDPGCVEDAARAEVARLRFLLDRAGQDISDLCGESARQKADLARVRAALETAANRLDIAASVIRSGAKFARWADEARAALEGRG
ncbi:MAG TPA: hypothetical protein VLA89_05640 [Gemmatimonadales bacterium]|nr:hypothetical protein [Gemmatimonadales bacterium]